MPQRGRICFLIMALLGCFFVQATFMSDARALTMVANDVALLGTTAIPMDNWTKSEAASIFIPLLDEGDVLTAPVETLARSLPQPLTEQPIATETVRSISGTVYSLNRVSFDHERSRSSSENSVLTGAVAVSFLNNNLENGFERGVAREPHGVACPLGGFHEEGAHMPSCGKEGAGFVGDNSLVDFEGHPNGADSACSAGTHVGNVYGDALPLAGEGESPTAIPAHSPESLGGFTTDETVLPTSEYVLGEGGNVESQGTLEQNDVFQRSGISQQSFAAGERETAFVSSLLSKMSLPEKVGQLIMVGFRGTGEGPDPALQKIMEGIHEGKIGGVILFDYDVSTQNPVRNIVSLEQVRRLTNQLQRLAPLPLFVGIDQEGGRVARLKSTHGMPELASPKFLGSGPVEVSFEAYSAMAKLLADVGVNINFAPSVDVDVDPLAPAIGKLGRSYSAEPAIVTGHAEAFASALEKHGLMMAFKHFPGHGSAANDTHLGLADVTETWEGQELDPYKALLPKYPQAMVMVGHVFHKMFDETYPASLSKNIITGVLRHDLGWEGLVITDDLDMQAISNYYSIKECAGLALNAGVDILLFGNNLQYDSALSDKLFQGVMELVEEGEVLEDRINEACERVLRAKYRLASRLS